MSIRTSPWPAGVPCWTDLVTPDVEAAQRFYAAVMGWDFAGTGEEYGGYVIAQVRGAAAAGIGPVPEGGQPAWTLYLASDDADATATAVRDHGGTMLVAPGDVGPLGRMFLAADPTGAVFGVWQAGSHIGASLVNEPGGLSWEDLRSPDPDKAREFYVEVFGYRTDRLEMAGPDYTTFSLPDERTPLGGMGGLFGADAPHWLVYFAVTDTEAAAAAGERGGGQVLAAPFATPFGVMATIADPAGAVFQVVQNTGQPQPDRAG